MTLARRSWLGVFMSGLLLASLAGCRIVGENYSENLQPLNIVTYVTADQQVVRRRAYFGDDGSNVIVLTDDVRDGLLPDADQDGLVDGVGLEVYSRGLLLDLVISRGVVYHDHIVPQKVKSLDGVSIDAVRVLTRQFNRQNHFMKTASDKTEYEITLKTLRPLQNEALINVDGSEGVLKRGEMRMVGRVYMTLDQVRGFETDSGFAVIRISDQAILLKPGQKTRVRIIPGTVGRATGRFLKEERVHFIFLAEDALPTRESARLEDIFHTFLVDRPDRQHVSVYRMVRETSDTAPLPRSQAAGVRINSDPFEGMPPGGFFSDVTGQAKDAVWEVMRFFYGKKN